MFRYVNDVSFLSHHIIKNFCANFNCAVDATLGNGNDTDFLSDTFSKVYAFEIQNCAVMKYRERMKKNVILIEDSHEYIEEYIKDEIDCIMFNLGFLPGGDKNITTMAESTIKCLSSSLKLLKPEGIITIAVYSGHEEGKNEKEKVLRFLEGLPKNQFGVLTHNFINRNNNPPSLIVVEKK